LPAEGITDTIAAVDEMTGDVFLFSLSLGPFKAALGVKLASIFRETVLHPLCIGSHLTRKAACIPDLKDRRQPN